MVAAPRISSSAAEPLKPVRYRMLGRWVTTNPSNPSLSSATLSAACRSIRRSACTESADERLQSQQVALGAEARHHTQCEIRNDRMPALRLASEDVGQMQLYEWNLNREKG